MTMDNSMETKRTTNTFPGAPRLALLVAGVVLLSAATTAARNGELGAVVEAVDGDVEIRLDEQGPWNELSEGDAVPINAEISTGFGVDWAGTLLMPLSLTFDNDDGENTATFSDANFGGGFAGRFGIGYGFSPFRGLVITPGVAWHAIFSSYSFDFPGGATVYRELTHGPAAVGQIAFMFSDNFGLQGGAMYGYSPFHFGGLSNSGDDEDMDYGTVIRGWLGVRVPFDLTGTIF